MISLNSIGSLVSLLKNSDPQSAKALIKLLSVDVLKSLDDDKYLLQTQDKTLTAQSQKKLQVGERYFAKYTQTKQETPILSNLIKVPKLLSQLKELHSTPMLYNEKTLKELLLQKDPVGNFKETLLDTLAKTTSKEQFHTTSLLLLSLHQGVFTLPFVFYHSLGFLQIKKRYNKKEKKSFLDFYAFFEHLGAISGVISQEIIRINVGYKEIKEFLEEKSNELSYPLDINVITPISPLYDITQNNSLLDITT